MPLGAAPLEETVIAWRSLLPRRAVELRLEPLAGVERDAREPDAYLCAGAEPTFRLVAERGAPLPGGWVHLAGTCERRGAELFATLIAIDANGRASRHPVPMTRAGRIDRVLRLPDQVHELRWIALEGAGKVVQRGLRVTALGGVERRARMAGWAAHDLWKFRGTGACASVGLSWRGLAVSIERAYEASGRLRVHAPRIAEDELARRERAKAEAALAALRASLHDRTGAAGNAWRVAVLIQARGASDADVGRVRAALDAAPAPWPLGIEVARDTLASEKERERLAAADAVVVVDARHATPGPEAVEWLAYTLLAFPELRLVTADDVLVDTRGERVRRQRRDLHWNPERIGETCFVGHLVAVRGATFHSLSVDSPAALGPFAVALAAMRSAAATAHRHVPHPVAIAHRPVDERSAEERAELAAALRAHAHGERSFALAPGLVPGTLRVDYPLPAALPTVSALIPTRDAPAVLRTCVESLLAKTTYPKLELVVIDNGSRDRDALAYLSDLERRGVARVLRDDRPFNFAALNNRAVRETRGELLAFLNNDIEVLDGSWLEAMVRHAVRPEIGAVGAKLLYPDGFVQHAGVIIDPHGNADHAFRLRPGDDPGPEYRLVTTQRCLAVTAACMLVRRQAFDAAGGFDEEKLAIAFNDVDLCLKLRARGLENVWTPHARLVHHESYSRGRDNDTYRSRLRGQQELHALRARWRPELTSRDTGSRGPH